MEELNMNTDLMFSSKTDMWETPQELFEKYRWLYNLKLDVCATAENAKLPQYITPAEDALRYAWDENFWMNPPYGRGIGKWIEYAYRQSREHDVTGVLLLPARTDTRWFHELILDKGKIEFLKGRIKFNGHKNPAPFPSMIVVYNAP